MTISLHGKQAKALPNAYSQHAPALPSAHSQHAQALPCAQPAHAQPVDTPRARSSHHLHRPAMSEPGRPRTSTCTAPAMSEPGRPRTSTCTAPAMSELGRPRTSTCMAPAMSEPASQALVHARHQPCQRQAAHALAPTMSPPGPRQDQATSTRPGQTAPAGTCTCPTKAMCMTMH
ncbi:hypothetical protein I3842_05G151100 [Carya illinoinensis]|uniref:Uncharacterized protein n=1 Tax=Carya illinoinensis TaxID=32201 RepID=A0A922F551_CARIL|nr:hypothetical protein I3842_05G151100 [Carya illinoinensis]